MSETRTRIKICGITNFDDARAAVDYGADALGFIFVPQSPRFVADAAGTAKLLEQLPPLVARVGVCVEPSQIPVSFLGRLSAIQLYAHDWQQDGSDASVRSGGLDLILACRVRDEASLEGLAAPIERVRPKALLLDTYHKDKLGGSGETFNWEIAIEARRRFGLPLILAGGLTPDNVQEAIERVRPYAVDVSSGVEAEPGRKDHQRLKEFLRAVRRADASL